MRLKSRRQEKQEYKNREQRGWGINHLEGRRQNRSKHEEDWADEP